MKKKILLLVCFLAILLMIPRTVSANIGPNPSTIINFIGFEGELYYVALLSEEPEWGHGDYVSESDVEELKEKERVELSDSDLAFIKFATYYDKDNFHLIGSGIKDCSNKHNYTYTWAYNIPQEIKILIYFPETDKIIASDVLENYAFDSIFKVEFLGSTIVANKARTPLDEIASISVRIFLIILIELGIAWLFKFRQKNQIRFITVFTIVTQLVYSISLLIIEYKLGKFFFVVHSFIFMLFIIIIKAITYLIYFKKKSAEKISAWRVIPYVLIVSFLSWYIGIRVALFISSL